MTRIPQRVLSLGNILRPFDTITWSLTLFVVLSLCLLLLCTHRIYLSVRPQLVLPEESSSNFFIYGMCKITEPDPLPWFKGGVSGKWSVFLWSLFALLMIMFYQSNLRAYMITVDYEDPMDTLEDVATQGRKVWIPGTVSFLRYKLGNHLKVMCAIQWPSCSTKGLEKAGRTGEMLYQVALRAEKTGGLFIVNTRTQSEGSFGGLPAHLVQVCFVTKYMQ